jgi:hypothetical protein
MDVPPSWAPPSYRVRILVQEKTQRYGDDSRRRGVDCPMLLIKYGVTTIILRNRLRIDGFDSENVSEGMLESESLEQ